MKKLFSMVLLTSFSIGVSNAAPFSVKCFEYADSSTSAEASAYGSFESMDDEMNAWLAYYDLCEENAGNIADPVFM